MLLPTPSDEQHRFSLKYVLEASAYIGEQIAKKPTYHLVVITSTVMPGAMQNEVRPMLEKYSRKRCGIDFGLCYNPEFVALGTAMSDLLNPDFVLIGESDPLSGRKLADFYRRLCENSPAIVRMNFINAELSKLAVNTFVTTKISFANMLARLCERLPGADANVITSVLGLDSRIGEKYLKGAIGYGGPCFPRDNLALASLGRSLGLPLIVAEATDTFNRQQVEHLQEIIKRNAAQFAKVGILGLAYKQNSDVVEESQGLFLAQALVREGMKVIVYDPQAMENARKVLQESVTYAVSAKDCIQKSDVVVITTPWEEFRGLFSEDIARYGQPRVLIDCWRILEKIKEEEIGIVYIPLGVGGIR
jgi:UDPglucose 6-dehydrogenase